jgi:hypothetical protein
MVYKNKTYIAFDGDKDIRYYNLMKAWRDSNNNTFNFHDAHDLNTARDTSIEASIKSQLRKRFSESKALILLIGESTYRLTKFVKWEIETAKRLNLPIILVNLKETSTTPNWFSDYPVIRVPFRQESIQYAMNNWPNRFKEHQRKQDTGVWFYK